MDAVARGLGDGGLSGPQAVAISRTRLNLRHSDPRNDGPTASAHPAGRDSDPPSFIPSKTRIEPVHRPGRNGTID
jgi:hypothetical protein